MNKPLLCLLAITVAVGIGAVTYGGQYSSTWQPQPITSKHTSIAIVDDTNQLVSLESMAQRVVSISSADSELLLALGVDPVGVVSAKNLPQSVQERLASYPSMNSAMSPNVERIIMANPDLVIGIAMPFQTSLRKVFRQTGIQSFYHMSTNYDDIRNHVLHVGTMTGHTEAAQALVASYDATLESIIKRHQHERAPRILIVFGTPTSYQLASSKTYVGDICKRLGADNAADAYLPPFMEDGVDGYIPLNLETMSVLDCDKVLLIHHGNPDGTEVDAFKKAFKSPAWQNVPAVAQGRIEVLPDTLFSSVPTARIDQVLLATERVLYGSL